jgi:tetratricopeptide (TPR) repeat protein
VDFDSLYDDIFLPAISAVSLPEGGKLESRRTDKDFYSGDIKLEMFQYLEYSRFALADISGLNFNVAYELGARHRARECGTAIFRQTQFSPPFDISSIKAFPYEFEPFTRATSVEPGYGEAWREKGIVENKIAQSAKKAMDTDPAPGESSLRRAIELNNKDFDAYASLGGVLKQAKRFAQALAAYEQSYKVSGGHPYPLLNALKLRVQVKGSLTLSGSDKLALARAERIREGQSQQNPPFDKPWCFFDLAEIKLYRGDPVAFRDVAIKGLEQTDANWQGRTFVDSLRLLLPASHELPGLKGGLAELEQMVQ